MNRAGHLRQAKDRALGYTEQGKIAAAMASIIEDLDGHPETQDHQGLPVMMWLAERGDFMTPGRLAEFIRGFR